jgi:hypothetical protein
MTPVEMARILRDFKIKSGTIFQLGPRGKRGHSAQGFYWHQFEAAFASYCPPKNPIPRPEELKPEKSPPKNSKPKPEKRKRSK